MAYGALPGQRFRPHRITAAEQGEARLEAAAHVLKEGPGRGHVLFEHLGGDLDLGQRAALGRQFLQRAAVGGQLDVQPMQLRQMAGDGEAGFPGGVGVGHPRSVQGGRLRDD